MPPLAVNVVLAPVQKLKVPLIAAVGGVLMVTTLLSVSVQPLASVTVTVYVPAVVTTFIAVFVVLLQA